MATVDSIIAATLTRIQAITEAGVEEFGTGGERARTLQLDALNRQLERMYALQRAGQGGQFIQAVEADV